MNSICDSLDINSLCNSFDYSIDPIAITDANWQEGVKFIYVNNAFSTQTGYLKDELIGKSPKIFQGEESNYKILEELKQNLIDGKDFIGQSINYKKDGSSYYVNWSISPLKNSSGEVVAYISFQKVIDKRLKVVNDKLLSSIVQTSNNLILVTDLSGVIVYVNDSFNKTHGYHSDELIGQHSKVLKSGKQDKIFYKNMWESLIRYGEFNGVFESRKKDGTFFYDKKEIKTLKDENGTPIYYVSISNDISKQRKEKENLKRELYIDPLTKVYNRRKYEEVIEEKMIDFELKGNNFCLALIDIDHFKSINDNYGHDMGDYVLEEFVTLIKENIRDNDMLFRWGGEEFALLIDKSLEESFNICEKLRLKISSYSFQSIKITASFGLSEIKKQNSSKSLFINSDKALYEAKQTGRNKIIIHE